MLALDNVKTSWWASHRPSKRRLVQLYCALLYNAHLKGFLEGEKGKKAYGEFLQILLGCDPERAVLWHCTAGKDRAGFATAIVLEILGADRDTITQNYLRTNELIEDDIQRMIGMFFRMTGAADPNTGVALKHMFSARKEYLEAAYDMVEKLYGDFGIFLNEGLGLRDEDISKMREMYLVPSRII